MNVDLLARTPLLFAAFLCCVFSGCNFIPDVRQKAQFHNPFPQIRTVAVLPFRNQSQASTLSGERVSLAYSHELQAVPGFEVLPVGAVTNQLLVFEQQLRRPVATPDDFQAFARYLGVDAVIQGAVTDYDPYYPPRLTMKTNWYTANPNFHPVPVGYGLPWGTKHEKTIPDWVRLEAERELASEQLVSQTPQPSSGSVAIDASATQEQMPALKSDKVQSAAAEQISKESDIVGTSVAQSKSEPEITDRPRNSLRAISSAQVFAEEVQEEPATATSDTTLESPNEFNSKDIASTTESNPGAPSSILFEQSVAPNVRWPDPEGFIPPLPSSVPPQPFNFAGPVISHMATYNGADEDFTRELEEYYYFRDDGRFGGWESYLQRSEDFIRFCCYLHIKQTLVGRGGQLKNRTVVRWPFSRYQER